MNPCNICTNKQDNKLKDAPISLAIDKTAPSCLITGIEDDARYNDVKMTATVVVTDNLATGSVLVYVNDVLVREYTVQEVSEMGGKIPVEIAESNDYQTIRAETRDAAGNYAESDTIRILVTTNPWMRFYRNTPLFVGSLSGLGLLAAGGFFLLFKRRKDDEEKTAGSAPTNDLNNGQ